MGLTSRNCTAINDAFSDNEDFFSSDGIVHWDAHRIGWLVAGICAVVSTLISLFSVWQHARNYYHPKEQRQILRILLMPSVYAIMMFFSYRYYKEYTYFILVVAVYEALVLAAFLSLLLQYIGESTEEQRKVLMEKEKSKIPFPFCCIRYRPSKPYWIHALKWSVLQYSFLRPLITLAGVITDAAGTGYSVYFSAIYLDAFDTLSISIALYGLITFYGLVKDRLKGRKPLAKFLSIKGIVILTFYQGWVFTILQDAGTIKATAYWTASNVADGLEALSTCCEMVIFSGLFIWAFHWQHYVDQRPPGAPHTKVIPALLNSLNYADFFHEGWTGLVFFADYLRGRPGTRSSNSGAAASQGPLDIDAAFLGVGSAPDAIRKPMGGQSYESSIAGGTYRMQDASQTELEMEKRGSGGSRSIGAGGGSPDVGYYGPTELTVRYGHPRLDDTQRGLDPRYAYGEAQ